MDFHDFVKICGVTSVEDAVVVKDAGASALGMVLAPVSKRRCAIEVATAIVSELGGTIPCIGVFRGQSDGEILELVATIKLTAVQLHDEASLELLAHLRALGVSTIIRAVSYGTPEYAELSTEGVDAVLVDGPEPGSGQSATWIAAPAFDLPLIVAGGLTPETVATWIERYDVSVVDVASGTEAAYGVKDSSKVASFVGNARAAWHRKRNA